MFSTPTQKCSKKDVEKVERAEDGVKTSPKFMLLQRFGYDLTTIREERDSSSPFKGSYVSEDVIQNKICSVMQQDKSYTQDAYQNMLRDCDITEQLVGNLLRGDLEEELTHKPSELYDELMAAFIEPPPSIPKLSRMDNRVSPDTYFQSHLHSLMSDGTELDLDLPTGVFAKWSAQISEYVEEIESHTANLDSEFVDGLLDVRYYCPTGCETVSRRMKRMYGDTFASAPCEDLMLKKFGYSSNSKYSSAEMLPRPDHWLDSSQHDPSQWAECNQNSDFSTNEEESTDTLQQMPSPTLQSVLYSRKQPVNILVQSARCLEEVMCCYLQVVNLILNCQSDGVAKLAVYTHLWSKFTDSMLYLNESCVFLNDSMKKVMAQVLPQYPNFPSYSVWRMMARAWIQLVYNPHRPCLDQIFFKCLLNHRFESIRSLAADSSSQSGEKFARSMMMRNLKGFQSDLDRDSYFDTKLGDDSTVGIIKAYANSVIDLSLNEVTVQAKNHTNVQVEKGYLKLESKIVRQSEALFLKLNPIQFGFDVFQRFLSVDSMVISNFFLRRTYLKCVQRIIKIEVDQIQLQIQSLSLGNTREESRLLVWKAPTDKGRAGTPLSLPFEAIIQGGFDKDGLSAEQEPCPLKAIPFQDVKLSIFKMTQDDPSSEDDFVPPPTKKSHSSGTMNLKKSDSQPRIGCESLKSNRSSRRELMDLVRSKRGLSGHEAQPDEQTSSLQDLRAELLDLSVKYEQRFELLNKQVGHYLEEHGIPLDLGDAVIFFGLQRQITIDYVHQVTKTNLAQIQDAEEQAISEEGMDEPGPRLQRFSPLDAMSMGSSADSSTVGGTVFVPPEGGEFKLPWLETIVVDHRIVKAEIN